MWLFIAKKGQIYYLYCGCVAITMDVVMKANKVSKNFCPLPTLCKSLHNQPAHSTKRPFEIDDSQNPVSLHTHMVLWTVTMGDVLENQAHSVLHLEPQWHLSKKPMQFVACQKARDRKMCASLRESHRFCGGAGGGLMCSVTQFPWRRELYLTTWRMPSTWARSASPTFVSAAS